MSEFFDFLMNHWQLSSLFIAILVAYAMFEFKQEAGSKEASPDQTVDLINHQHGVILDVRSKEEFNKGHIVGAIHVDPTESDLKLKKLNKYSQKPVIVVCSQGKRSANFVKRLEEHGFNQVLSLAGGLNAWQNAGLPLTTNATKE